MKLIPSFPSKSKKQNKLKKSESNPLSFSSSISSQYSSGTPKSVLPQSPRYNSISSSNSESSSSKPNSTDFDVLEVFKIFDRDNDGKITLSELELLFHRLGFEPPTQEELSLMLAEADLDGDGCISLEEFGALSSTLGPAHGSELRDAFDYFDHDKDGRISAEELHGVFLTLGDDGCTLEDCRRMIGGVDAEGKGFVGFEDFVRMMQAQRLFLIGLQKYGKGDWRSISRNAVVSRTPTQVASHAQKYFLRVNSVKKDKKRASIHDITTVHGGQAEQPNDPSWVDTSSGMPHGPPEMMGQQPKLVERAYLGQSTDQGPYGYNPFGYRR